MVEDFKSSMDEKITELEDKHSLQRKLLFKDHYGHSAIDHHARHGDKLSKKRNAVHPVSPSMKDQLDESETDLESGRRSSVRETAHVDKPNTPVIEEGNFDVGQTELIEETAIEPFEGEEDDE